jgi:hypothetical protein
MALVKGVLRGSEGPTAFIPDGLKSFALTFTPPGVVLRDATATACRECGCFWSRTDTTTLEKVLKAWAVGGGAGSETKSISPKD